jgi:hypothetical protein
MISILSEEAMASRNRGQKKPKLRDLSRTQPSVDEEAALSRLLTEATNPITVAIVGAVLVEHQLETLLRERIPRGGDQETWDILTNDVGPLSTFHRKIELAYAFQLVNPALRQSLHAIRDVRNAFAHAKRPLEFDHELIVREVSGALFRQKERKDHFDTQPLSKGVMLAYVHLCFNVSNKLAVTQLRAWKARTRRMLKTHPSGTEIIEAIFGTPKNTPRSRQE